MDEELRILSLLPSCTQIVLALGLRKHLVGVTHECEIDGSREEQGGILRVTRSTIDIDTTPQDGIDLAVKESVSSGLSLYAIVDEKFKKAEPTLILTQNLCSVCAPTSDEVERVSAAACPHIGIKVVSLEPTSLEEVKDTFMAVANACNVPDRGLKLQERFVDELSTIREAVSSMEMKRLNQKKPSLLLLEWLDPPFDGGHWIPYMVEIAGCVPPDTFGGQNRKSEQRTWDDIVKADPDVVIVACCGFDLTRNVADAKLLVERTDSVAANAFRSLRAVQNKRIYATNADKYYAQPSPYLTGGTALMARLAYDDLDDENLALLESRMGSVLPSPSNWQKLDLLTGNDTEELGCSSANKEPVEIEDCWKVHDEAVRKGKLYYTDPNNGLFVFTSLAHKNRGRCCGSGCRHCPYGHSNVPGQSRANLIQQPAMLHERRSSSSSKPTHRYVVFFSTGKDSFLALRRWISNLRGEETSVETILDSLILLTSFDMESKMIAHQDTSIQDAVRQAEHLNLDLIGVPLHPGTEYVPSIEAAMKLLRDHHGMEEASLIFGDLHLESIRGWRESALGHLGATHYPVFGMSYEDLFKDLEASGVPCVITSCSYGKELHPNNPCDTATPGRQFDKELILALREARWDEFGEDGEFHTLAQVWEVAPERALGLHSC